MVDGTNDDGSCLPPWLLDCDNYMPTRDNEAFLTRTFLQITSVLAQLRLDGGQRGRFCPSALAKALVASGLVVMVSLARNFVFVLGALAGMLLIACVLPTKALRRLVAVSGGAALLTLLVMLPAVFMGQARSPVTLAVKVLVTVGLTMEIALTTPAGEMAAALRWLRMPSLVILTFELTLRSIVGLGTVAQEVLTAMRLRSVGGNANKSGSLASVAGVTFIRAAQSASQTFDAMRCRGFTGDYERGAAHVWRAHDVAMGCVLVVALALFCLLERGV